MHRDQANALRYRANGAGHYESYFQRGNHPTRAQAFWIRYTIFSPKGRPQDAVGELWAIFFDGEAGNITAVKQQFPISECRFAPDGLGVQIKDATLNHNCLIGEASLHGHRIEWDLKYSSDDPPLLLLDRSLYGGGFPKAKALVGSPFAVYEGTITIDGDMLVIDDWVGSQNHNWGSKHTDLYAWGQVAGFDDAPDAFLEVSTARVKIGPIWTPFLTLIVLRVADQEYALNSLMQGVRAKGRFQYFGWEFASEQGDVRISGHMEAHRDKFVGLTYDNPPGGSKTCLNTKIARCSVTLECAGRGSHTYHAENRAAFEILTDDQNHGIPVVA